MSAESAARELIERGYIDEVNSGTSDAVAKIIVDEGPSCFPGMTLLDYFAGQALHKFTVTEDEFDDIRYAHLAGACYDMAAAMLAEKEKREWVKVEPPPLGKLKLPPSQ